MTSSRDDGPALAGRLDRLEVHVAEQQRALDDLSDVIARQTRELEGLKAHLRQSESRIAELEAGLSPPDTAPPPHY